METRQDILLGLIFISLGLAAAWMARDYAGASGTYPLVLGLVLTLLGGTVALKAVRSGSTRVRILMDAPAQLMTAVVIATLYVAAIVPLGFYTASFLLMLAMPLALGFRRGLHALVTAAVFIAIVYMVFSVLLNRPLPRDMILTLLDAAG
jgi:hypothetical protein